MISNSLRIVKTYSKISELRQIVCKIEIVTLIHLLVLLCEKPNLSRVQSLVTPVTQGSNPDKELINLT